MQKDAARLLVGRQLGLHGNLQHQDQISFVELVAKSEQTPSWFVSHWWGTAFHQSLRMLRLHHLARKLDANSFYWMCSFANNQHELDKDLASVAFAVCDFDTRTHFNKSNCPKFVPAIVFEGFSQGDGNLSKICQNTKNDNFRTNL